MVDSTTSSSVCIYVGSQSKIFFSLDTKRAEYHFFRLGLDSSNLKCRNWFLNNFVFGVTITLKTCLQ